MTEPFLSSDEYDEQAHQLYNEARYDAALALLREGLTRYPQAVELHVGLGYAQLAREEYAWARAAFDAALARSGIDIAHLRETIRENLRIRGYLAQRFSVSEDRRQQVVDDWVAGLRRRADIIDLYFVGR